MARNRPPSFDFYPDDIIGGTMHLHPFCMGIYLRLLCFQWSHGAIPEGERELLQVTGALPEELKTYLPQVLDKFEICEDGKRRNARLERERAKKTRVSDSRTAAANARWGQPLDSEIEATGENGLDANAYANNHANAYAKSMLPNRKLEVGSMDTGSNRNGEPKTDWIIPDRLDSAEIRELLSDFETMRRKKGKPVKDRAATSKIFKHFDDLEHLEFALTTCIANEYQGLKPDYRPVAKKDTQANARPFAKQPTKGEQLAAQVQAMRGKQ